MLKWLLVIVLVTLGAYGCKTAPAATSATPPVQPPVTAIIKQSTQSPAEAAWTKVVEAAKKEGKMTAYDFDLIGDIGIAAKSAFEKRYGIKLDIISGGVEFVERLKTERRMNQMVADYVSISFATTMIIRDEGLTEKVIERLPELRDKTRFVVDPVVDQSGHLMALGYNTYSPWIN